VRQLLRPVVALTAACFVTGAAHKLTAQTTYDSSAFTGLKWREIGPFRGGRSVAVAGSAARPMEYYFGTTGGQVYASADAGDTWAPIVRDLPPVLSVEVQTLP